MPRILSPLRGYVTIYVYMCMKRAFSMVANRIIAESGLIEIFHGAAVNYTISRAAMKGREKLKFTESRVFSRRLVGFLKF